MSSFRTAVLGVVFPGIEKFFADYLMSWSNQTDKDFVLCLINDGMLGMDDFLGRYSLPVELIDAKGTPSELRSQGILWVKDQGFDLLLFSDTDDIYSPNRVSETKRLLTNVDIILNELILFGEGVTEEKPLLSSRYKTGERLGWKSILQYNVFGLTNAAVRVDKIQDKTTDISSDVIAYDWAFFSRLLYIGAGAKFVPLITSYYRQHSNNSASLVSLTDEQILQGLEIKVAHYRSMRSFNPEYQNLYGTYSKLKTKLKEDKTLANRYCQAVYKALPAQRFWWEHIKTSEELGLWG